MIKLLYKKILSQNISLIQSQKWQNDLCSFPKQITQYHSNPSLWPKAKGAEVEQFYDDLQDLLEITPPPPKKDVLLIIVVWNSKVRSQRIPAVTGKFGIWGQNEAGKRLIKFCQESTLVIANTCFHQHNSRLYTWTLSDCQYWNQIDISFAAEDEEVL